MARGLMKSSMQLVRSFTRFLICGVLALVLGACAAGPTAGLQSYQSPDGRFAFLYPTGWTQVQVSNGPRVVFHDLIHSDETVSLMVNTVDEDNDLEELGSAVAVGLGSPPAGRRESSRLLRSRGPPLQLSGLL